MTTAEVLAALRVAAAELGLAAEVSEDIGADLVSRRPAAPPGTFLDPDGTVPHEAHVELGGRPRVDVDLYGEGDAVITVEGVPFHDVPHRSVVPFVRSLHTGLATVRSRPLSGPVLVVSLPGDETYREHLSIRDLTPWINSRIV